MDKINRLRDDYAQDHKVLLTGYAGAYDDHGSIGVVFVADRYLRPWFSASHCEMYVIVCSEGERKKEREGGGSGGYEDGLDVGSHRV